MSLIKVTESQGRKWPERACNSNPFLYTRGNSYYCWGLDRLRGLSEMRHWVSRRIRMGLGSSFSFYLLLKQKSPLSNTSVLSHSFVQIANTDCYTLNQSWISSYLKSLFIHRLKELMSWKILRMLKYLFIYSEITNSILNSLLYLFMTGAIPPTR